MNRRETVVALLMGRRDYVDPTIPAPRLATPRIWKEQTDDRESSYIVCPDCRGSGRRQGDAPCWVCVTCHRGKKPLEIPHPRGKAQCSECRVCNGAGERKARAGERKEAGYGVTHQQRQDDESKRPVRHPLLLIDRDSLAGRGAARSTAIDRSYLCLSRLMELLASDGANRDLVRWLGEESGSYNPHSALGAIAWLARRMPGDMVYPRDVLRSMAKDALRQLKAEAAAVPADIASPRCCIISRQEASFL